MPFKALFYFVYREAFYVLALLLFCVTLYGIVGIILKEKNSKIFRNINSILSVLALLFILYYTVFNRHKNDNGGFDLSLFNFYDFNRTHIFVMNIILFVPFGAFLPFCIKRSRMYVVLIVLSVTIVVEVFQLAFSLGMFQLDDILANFSGGIISILIFSIEERIIKLLIKKGK